MHRIILEFFTSSTMVWGKQPSGVHRMVPWLQASMYINVTTVYDRFPHPSKDASRNCEPTNTSQLSAHISQSTLYRKSSCLFLEMLPVLLPALVSVRHQLQLRVSLQLLIQRPLLELLQVPSSRQSSLSIPAPVNVILFLCMV